MNEPLEPVDPALVEARNILEYLARAAAPVPQSGPVPVANGDVSSPPTSGLDVVPGRGSVPQSWAAQTLGNLLESLPDALVVINCAGVIVLINTQTERMFGYQRQELLGQLIEILVPEESRQGHVASRTGYFANPRGRPMGAGLELRGRHKSGSAFPVEISLSPLETEHGLLVTAVVRDITQRKREEAKFRTLVENIPAVTFIAPLDLSAPEMYVSPQIEQMLGFSQKEWLEDPVLWHRQLHPDDQDRWNAQFSPTCVTGETFRSVYRFIAKDGRVVWVHGSAQMVRNNEGQPLFLQGIAFDVTAIKEAEAAERERAQLIALQAAVNSAVTRTDTLQGMLQRCAAALVEHLAVPCAQVWARDEQANALVLHGCAGQVAREATRYQFGESLVGLVAAGRQPLLTALTTTARGDELEWARCAGLTIFAGQPLLLEERLLGVVAVFAQRPLPPNILPILKQIGDEITLGISRKWAEEALRQLNAELEQRVQDRTEELARSMAELREKTEELEQFAYVASHDLREPLRTLVNYPQRLTRQYSTSFDAQATDWINRIANGAERMRRLIDSLSHYSRVLRRDRTYGPVECAVVVQEARANLQAAVEESRAELVVGELPTVHGNQQQLMLLFQNLLGNAIKFRVPERPVRVEVGCQAHEGDWLFWVRDNGIGIESRYLQRIFGLGERLHPASKYAGTGFGLAICEKIVAGHGGQIWAESELGQGSTFFFTLKRVAEEG